MEENTPKKRGFMDTVWRPILAPVLALSVICCVMSFLLGMTNQMTAPIIADNAARAADEARAALLPEADGFEELPITVDVPNVTALYGATNDAGYIVEAYGTGYGGQIPALVAFAEDGTIVGVTFLQNNETPGLGKKLETEASFSEQFSGLSAEPILIEDIDKIASSTISTNGALTAINAAIELYNQEIHGQSVDALAHASPEEGGEEAAA